MTVTANIQRADYNCNGVTTSFAVPFQFFLNTELQVIKTDSTVNPPVVTTLNLTTDYTVAGGAGLTGSITTVATFPTGVKLSILPSLPFTQNAHYVPNDPFPAAGHEAALDRLTLQDQQLEEKLNRTLVLPPQLTGLSGVLPVPVANASLVWDPTATFLMNGTSGSTAFETLNPAMDGVAAPGVRGTVTRGDHVHPTDTSRAPVASPTFTGTATAPTFTATTQFSGPGTGLTGTAASLTAGTATNATQLGGVTAASYALLASPTFTGTPAAPTAVAGTNTTQLATTAFVAVSFAPLASPALTGTPTAPTATAGTNSTQLATTAFVAVSFAPLASPALTGTPTAPTAAQGTNNTQLATTAYVDGIGTALGDMEYWSAAGTRARLAGNTTATRKFLRQTGTGTVSAAPAWDTILATDVPVFVASGASHATGTVPDPGASAGTTRFLREDATWAAPASSGISALFKSTSTVTVANTTTETSLFPTGSGSLTIPANSLAVGSYLRLTLRGTLQTLASTPGNQTIKIKIGGLTVCTVTSALVSSAAGSYTEIVADLFVTAIGSSGSVNGHGRWAHQDTSVGDTTLLATPGTAQTVNTTGTLAVDCTMTWATANASNTITINTATLEQL